MIVPMKCPPFGVALPVELVEIRDADTIVVRLRGMSLNWAVRLIDCWAPELNRGSAESRKLARAATEFARAALTTGPHADDLRWFVPMPPIKAGAPNVNLLSWLSFDRVPGYLFVGPEQTLNRKLVLAGLASSRKDAPLGT